MDQTQFRFVKLVKGRGNKEKIEAIIRVLFHAYSSSMNCSIHSQQYIAIQL